MATFQGNAAAMLLLASVIMASSVSLVAAEPALGGRRLFTISVGGEGETVVEDVDVEDGPVRSVLARTQSPVYGGGGGLPFDDGPHRMWISSLVLRCGVAVDQIRTKYPSLPTELTHGQSGGLEKPFTRITWSLPVTISVYTGPMPGEPHITSIVRGIEIRQGQENDIREMCGHVFATPGVIRNTLTNVILRGFKGRSGSYIDALGIYYD